MRGLAAERVHGQKTHKAAALAPLQQHVALSSQAIRLRDGRLAVGVTEVDTEQGASVLSSGSVSGRPTLWRRGLALFLPMGYPASVAPGYAAFSRWQFVHMATGAVTGGTCRRLDPPPSKSAELGARFGSVPRGPQCYRRRRCCTRWAWAPAPFP